MQAAFATDELPELFYNQKNQLLTVRIRKDYGLNARNSNSNRKKCGGSTV